MSENWKTWTTVVGSIASLVVVFTTLGPGWFLDREAPERMEAPSGDFIPWEDTSEEVVEQEPPPPPPEGLGFWLRLRGESEPVDATALVGIPGVWPFKTLSSHRGGYLLLPENQAPTLDGRTIQLYEVLVRTGDDVDPPVAFWGVTRGPDAPVEASEGRTLRLREAQALTVTVVDDDGEPVEGAFVRLARDSMALLNLHYTTREDGVATFSRIPPGTYFLTLDADGVARKTVRVEHALGDGRLTVPMESGGGLRMPFSWQGPPVQLMAGSASGSSESSGSGEEDGDRGAGEERAGGTERELNVYAADERGGGVAGAWVEAWVGGRRVAQGQSRGNRPLTLRVPADGSVTVVATHAGWGEGMEVASRADDGQEVIVRMSNELLTARGPTDRVRSLGALEEILEAPIVEDGSRLLIDRPDAGSAAAAAGLQRGDSLLFVRREGRGHRAVVERRGSLQEISF